MRSIRISRIKSVARILGLGLGIVLAIAGRSDAQGYGYGYGGWGYGGGFGFMGMSLYDQQMIKQEYFMNSVARFNLENARTAQAYQSANLMQQEAIRANIENQRLAYQTAKERYDLRSREAADYQASKAALYRVPLDRLFDAQGNVLWPDFAPSGGIHGERQQAADEAIRAVYLEARSNQANVSSVVTANHLLHAYGQPALDLLRTRGDTRARAELVNFLNSVEVAVTDMGRNHEPAK